MFDPIHPPVCWIIDARCGLIPAGVPPGADAGVYPPYALRSPYPVANDVVDIGVLLACPEYVLAPPKECGVCRCMEDCAGVRAGVRAGVERPAP